MSALLKVNTAKCETGHDNFGSDVYLSLTFIFVSHLTLFVVEMRFLFDKGFGENRRGKEQRYTNPGRKIAVVNKFFAVASNNCRYPLWYLLLITIPAPIILRGTWIFGKFIHPWKNIPLYLLVFLLCVHEVPVSNLPRENSYHDFSQSLLSDAS